MGAVEPYYAIAVSGDKEIEFSTRVAHMEIKQKFPLEEMTFDGKLQL